MNAPTYMAKDLAPAFGDNYSTGDATTRGALIPVNALHSCAEELGVLSLAANEGHTDFEMSLVRLGRRMELAAEIGFTEIKALLDRVQELEAERDLEVLKNAAQAKKEPANG